MLIECLNFLENDLTVLISPPKFSFEFISFPKLFSSSIIPLFKTLKFLRFLFSSLNSLNLCISLLEIAILCLTDFPFFFLTLFSSLSFLCDLVLFSRIVFELIEVKSSSFFSLTSSSLFINLILK